LSRPDACQHALLQIRVSQVCGRDAAPLRRGAPRLATDVVDEQQIAWAITYLDSRVTVAPTTH